MTIMIMGIMAAVADIPISTYDKYTSRFRKEPGVFVSE